MNGKEIKIKLVELEKRQKDLVFALRKRGYKVDNAALSAALNGLKVAPWTQRLIAESQKILIEWENEI